MNYINIKFDNEKIGKSNNNEEIFKRKIIALGVICVLGSLILIGRLFYVQIIKNSYYDNLARNNKEQIIPVDAYRGEIYDRNGIIVAENVKRYTMYIIPVYLPKNYFEKEELLHRVSKVFNIDLGNIKSKLKKHTTTTYDSVEIAEDITLAQMSYLAERSEEYPGVFYSSKSIRNYPQGETMTHIIGYIGNISQDEYKNKREEGYRLNSMIGKEGVEQYYDKELRGIDGYVQWIVDARNRVKETITPSTGKPIPGKKLILSIDSKIQKDAEELIRGRVASIIVSRPTTGEILALVSSPWYDPNIFIGGINQKSYNELINDPENPFWNKSIRGRYAPASTLKLVTSVGVLNEGYVTANSTRYCGGGMRLENRWYKCTGHHGAIGLHKALQTSCNTYFYNIAYELGPNFLKKYADMFGLSEETGIDLPGEKIGTVPSSEWKRRKVGEYWWDGDTIQFVLGQGYMSTTPIAVHMATSAIINDGIMYRPQVVKEIRSSQTDEVIYDNTKEVLRTLEIKKAIFNTVKEGMRLSATSGTSATGAWSPNIPLAAKTGTAENQQGKNHSWITAFGPYSTTPNDDMIAVTVMIEHGGGGGLNAGPVATALLRSILGGEDPQAVRDDIYTRMTYVRNQKYLRRMKARQEEEQKLKTLDALKTISTTNQ